MLAKRTWDYWLLWLVALVSLGLNGLIINALLDARRQVGVAAGTAADAIGQLRSGVIEYNVHIDEQLPVQMTINYKDTLVVPISATLPISTQVTAKVQIPLIGELPVVIPVYTFVPVSFTQKIPINLAVPISTSVPVLLDVPIRIDLGTTALGTSLNDVEAYLRQTATNYREPK